MSLRKPPEARRSLIKQKITQINIDEIAKLCGVSERTIDRDIAHMKETGEWQDWIELELLRLHINGEVDDDIKYREMAKLYARTIIQKREVETIGRQDVHVTFDRDMKDESPDPLSPPLDTETVP